MKKDWIPVFLIAVAAVAVFAFGQSDRAGFAPIIGVTNSSPRDPEKSYGAPTLAAIGGAMALSGDLVRVGDATFRVQGVNCPDPSTEQGKDAKALANTFLKMTGEMSCLHSNGEGDCIAQTVDGRRALSEILRESGYCK